MTWRFRIDALADPQALPRILDLFAQRSITPVRVSAECEGERLRCEVAVAQLAPSVAELLAEKLRAMVMISRVTIDHGPEVIDIDNTHVPSDVSDQAA